MDIRWILLLTTFNYHVVKGGGCGCFPCFFGGRSGNNKGESQSKKKTAHTNIAEFNSRITNLSAQTAVKVNEEILNNAVIIIYLNILIDHPHQIELLQLAHAYAQGNRTPSNAPGAGGHQVTKLPERINKLKKQYEIALGNIVEILGKDLNDLDAHLFRATDLNALNELHGKLEKNKDELQQRYKDLREFNEEYKAVLGDKNLQGQIQNAESLKKLLHELRQIGKLLLICEIIDDDLKVRAQWTSEYIIRARNAAKQALESLRRQQ